MLSPQFYGPLNFHPTTTNDQLRATGASFSSTPFIENQSLYWHPSIYEKTRGDNPTYTRVSNLESSPYYRWDNSVTDPDGETTQAFPKDFKMIAYSDMENSATGGETGGNLFIECCDYNVFGQEVCTSNTGSIQFPTRNCAFLGIAMAMPTCWDAISNDSADHKSHVAYTLNGEVAGECPSTHPKRLPQVQLFIRITNYRGAEVDYVLSDEATTFHVDFMNGWEENKLQSIIDNCPIEDQGTMTYNPPCNCDELLTQNTQISGQMCDSDVRSLIADEATDVVSALPRKATATTAMISKSWTGNPPVTTTCSVDGPDDEGPDDEGPDDDDTCRDDDVKFVLENQKKKPCKWVLQKKTSMRCNKLLDNGDRVRDACPVACSTDCTPVDNPGTFQMPNGTTKRCGWAAKNLPKRCKKWKVLANCPETCSSFY